MKVDRKKGCGYAGEKVSVGGKFFDAGSGWNCHDIFYK